MTTEITRGDSISIIKRNKPYQHKHVSRCAHRDARPLALQHHTIARLPGLQTDDQRTNPLPIVAGAAIAISLSIFPPSSLAVQLSSVLSQGENNTQPMKPLPCNTANSLPIIFHVTCRGRTCQRVKPLIFYPPGGA